MSSSCSTLGLVIPSDDGTGQLTCSGAGFSGFSMDRVELVASVMCGLRPFSAAVIECHRVSSL